MNSFAVACIGTVLGGIVAVVWTSLARWFADNSFWRSIRDVAEKLVAAPPPREFFRQYAVLVRSLGIYLLKTCCRVSISVLPVIAALCLLWPMIAKQQLNLASHLVVYPPQDVVVRVSDQTVVSRSNGSCDIPIGAASEPGEISASHGTFTVPSLTYPVALSNSPVSRMVLLLCGFKVHGGENVPPLLILRPSAGDANPLWPYFSDLEFLFWLAMFGGSLLAGAVMKWLPLRWHRTRAVGHQAEQKPTAVVVLRPSTRDLPR